MFSFAIQMHRYIPKRHTWSADGGWAEDQNAVPRPAQLAKYPGAHHSTMPWRRAAACPPPIGGCPMALVACARPTACTAWTSAPGPQRRPSQSSPQISFPSSSLPSRPSRRLFLATCESAHCARGHNTPIQPPTVILRGRPGSPCDLQLLARDVARSVPLRDTLPSPSLSLSTIAFAILLPRKICTAPHLYAGLPSVPRATDGRKGA